MRGIAKFKKLKKLNLDSNKMSELPDEMRTLGELRSLSLRYTKNLAEFPAWLGELKISDIGLTREENARVANAVPHAQMDPKNVLL